MSLKCTTVSDVKQVYSRVYLVDTMKKEKGINRDIKDVIRVIPGTGSKESKSKCYISFFKTSEKVKYSCIAVCVI